MPPLRLLMTALVSVLLMSAVPVLVKSTVANEVTIGIVRLLIAVALLTPLVLWRGRLGELNRRDYWQMFVIGAVFAAHWLTYFISIKLATAAIAATAIATYGVQYLLLAWWFNDERFSWQEWLAIVVCLAGCAVVMPELTLSNSVTLGIVVGVISGFGYACLPLLHQRLQSADTLQRSYGQFFFALLCFLPLWPLSDWQLEAGDWYRLILLGVMCTLIAHGLWVKASTELPPLFTGLIYYLYIPSAMVSSWWFLDERITVAKVVGATMILGASTAVTVYRFSRSRAAV